MTSMRPSCFRTPEELIDELDIHEPAQLDVVAIAQHCGATVLFEPLQGCAARLLGYGDRAIITVDSESLPARQRFSVAHELAHWLRDRHRVTSFACAEGTVGREWSPHHPETRANRWAANLLLPEHMFRRDLAQLPLTLDSAQSLADRYGTSLTATVLRLVSHGDTPAMVLMNERQGKRWRWFRRGPDLPSELWPRDRPEEGSLAHDLLQGGEVSDLALPVAAEAWFEHPAARRRVVTEHSLDLGESVLSLLWWQDQSMLLEMLEEG